MLLYNLTVVYFLNYRMLDKTLYI